MNTIQSQWEYFEKMLLSCTSDRERWQAKIAFYAGVSSLLKMQTLIVSANPSDEAASAIAFGWHQECEMFATELLRKAKN